MYTILILPSESLQLPFIRSPKELLALTVFRAEISQIGDVDVTRNEVTGGTGPIPDLGPFLQDVVSALQEGKSRTFFKAVKVGHFFYAKPPGVSGQLCRWVKLPLAERVVSNRPNGIQYNALSIPANLDEFGCEVSFPDLAVVAPEPFPQEQP